MRITPADQIDLAAENLLRATHALPAVLRNLTDAMAGQPGAQSYDAPRVSGHTTVLDDRGVPMPAIADPTGEAATSPDPARAAERRIGQLVGRLERNSDELVCLLAAWQYAPVPQQDVADVEHANTLHCERHARYGHDRRAEHRSTQVRVQGVPVLSEPHRLCRWCVDFVRGRGRLPTEQEVSAHVQGRRLRRPA